MEDVSAGNVYYITFKAEIADVLVDVSSNAFTPVVVEVTAEEVTQGDGSFVQ